VPTKIPTEQPTLANRFASSSATRTNTRITCVNGAGQLLYCTSSYEEFAIPRSLILEKSGDAAVVDWFEVDATTSGDRLGFDVAAQAAF
jgi:hypothetical protein